MNIRLSAIGLSLALLCIVGCAPIPIPAFFASPTPPPTQVPLPTRVAIAVPTPTLANLVPPGDSEAAMILTDFIDAISKGNVNGALTYWNTSQPGQPAGYDANVRKMVQEWVDQKRQLILTDITYSGVDATGKYVAMSIDDPRVDKATAFVRIDGVTYRFFLTQLKGGWFIEGVNTAAK